MSQLPAAYYSTPIGRDLLRWLDSGAELVQRDGLGRVVATWRGPHEPTMQTAP